MSSGFHPDLRDAEFLPREPLDEEGVRTIQSAPVGVPEPAPADVDIVEVEASGVEGGTSVSLRVYRPVGVAEPAAIYWMHGGGFIAGDPVSDDPIAIAFVRRLGVTVVSVRYRLVPPHRAPAALDDAYAGLAWTVTNAALLGIDPRRIAIGGASAGAGLAASLAQIVLDRREFQPAFQLLVYPMLDDRTATRTDVDTRFVRGWEAASNALAWRLYLGQEPGLADAPEYVVPARRNDLAGLPPAWIGVGDLDLFYDEDLDYGRRLRAAGVECEVAVVEGAFHGFDDIYPTAAVSIDFLSTQVRVLAEALGIRER